MNQSTGPNGLLTIREVAERMRCSVRSVQSMMVRRQIPLIITTKKLARQLGVNLIKRKIAQAIPVIGASIGATVNAWYISDVCWAARRTFQEMWLKGNGWRQMIPVEANIGSVGLRHCPWRAW